MRVVADVCQCKWVPEDEIAASFGRISFLGDFDLSFWNNFCKLQGSHVEDQIGRGCWERFEDEMAEQINALKYVTYALSACRRDRLPQIVPSLSKHLNRCTLILCGQNTQGAALVHKLKTQIASLLQDKSIHGRWAAVVLVKTVVEAVVKHQAGWDFLQNMTSWVRGLLGILGKPDPVATRTLAMIVVTRIFLLTHGRPTLTREITTPHLNSFITTCLNTVFTRSQGSKSLDLCNPLLETVLQCLIRLTPNHPAVFRPFLGQIRAMLAPLLAPTPSDYTVDETILPQPLSRRLIVLAQRLHALLPSCAAKNGSAEEWRKGIHIILRHITRTADIAFRAVRDKQAGGVGSSLDFPDEPSDHFDDELSLPHWTGLFAGFERICGLLSLLSAHLSTKSNSTYPIPIKSIYEMADGMLSITRPESSGQSASTENINRQISREERERLYMAIPRLHITSLQVLSAVIDRMSIVSLSFAADLLEQVAWLISRSNPDEDLRSVVYKVFNQIIQVIGPSIEVEQSASIKPILRLACKELSPEDEATDLLANGNSHSASHKAQYSADSFTLDSKQNYQKSRRLSELQLQAVQLLTIAILRVPAPALYRLRSDIDNIAVILQNKDLQLSSVLNPLSASQQSTTLLPFLVSSHPDELMVEALIQRRIGLKVVQNLSQTPDDSSSEDDQGMDYIQSNISIPVSSPGPAEEIVQFPTDRTDRGNLEPTIVTVTELKRPLEDEQLEQQRLDVLSKRSRLDIHTEDDVSQPSESTTKIITSKQQPALSTVEREADGNDTESDGSFEIPQIVVDSDDEEDASDAD